MCLKRADSPAKITEAGKQPCIRKYSIISSTTLDYITMTLANDGCLIQSIWDLPLIFLGPLLGK
jgi:hypothetical protein